MREAGPDEDQVRADLEAIVGPLRGTPHWVLRGQRQTRASVTTMSGTHLWIETRGAAVSAQHWPVELVDESPAPSVRRSVPVRPWAHLVVPASVDGARVSRLPWPARLLATAPTPQAARALGALLRRIHASGALSAPVASQLSPPAVIALRERPSPLLSDELVAGCVSRTQERWAQAPCVRLHGAPGSGLALVPTDGGDGPAAVLLAGPPRSGPAWFDVGHLTGDLTEITTLLDVPSLSAQVRSGYDGDDPLPESFWQPARDASVLAVVAHWDRIEKAHGMRREEESFLRHVARHLAAAST